MELWVRSQDKRTLINTRRIDVDDCNIICWDEGKYASEVYMGLYKSKERALEVLDDIQNKLLKSKYDKASEDYGKHSDYKDTLIEISSSNYVYEMPEE